MVGGMRCLHRCALLAAVLPAPTFAQEMALLLPEMVVSAGTDPGELRRHASAAMIVFDRKDIEALDADSVGDLLRKLPGTGLSADMEGKRGRGKGPDKMMPTILVDGEPLPGGARNPAIALRLSPELIERIEVIRNGGAEYPAAGPGGIINIVLRDVPPRPTLNLRAGIGAQAGEAVARFDGQYGTRDGAFGWLLAGSANRRPITGERTTDIQRFAAGTRTAWTLEDASARGHDDAVMFAPRFNWRLADGGQIVLSPFISAGDEHRETLTRKFAHADPVAGTGLATSGTNRERDTGRRESARLVTEWRAQGAAARPWTELSLRAIVQGEHETKRKDRREFDAFGTATTARAERETRTERETGLVFKGKRPLGETHLLGLGAEWRAQSGNDRRGVTLDGVAQASDAAAATRQRDMRTVLWVQDEWQIDERHLLTPGLRLQAQDSRSVDGLGAVLERTTRSAAPSLHWLWQLDPAWNLRASLARHEKASNMRDLSDVVRAASGTNSSGNPDKSGNPQLRPEISLNLEAGVEHFLPDRTGNLGVSVFRRQVDHHVQKLVRLESARWVERPFNVGGALLTGATLDFKARLDAFALPQLTLRGNLARVATRIVDPVAGLGASTGPRTSLNLGFDYDLREHRLSFGGNFNAVSAIDRESSASVRQTQDARRQFDLYARKKLDGNLALRLSISNLGHPDRTGWVDERDHIGQLARRERDTETTATLAMLTLEGRW